MITLEAREPLARPGAVGEAVTSLRRSGLAGRRFVSIGAAFFKRDMLADLSYRLSFALHALNVLCGVAAYYFLARFVDRAALHGAAPFPFLLIGLALNAYMSTWLVCFTEAIRTGQATGTATLVFASPISPIEFILFSALYPTVRATVDASVYLLFGLAFGASLAHADAGAAVAIFVLSALAFAAIGIGSAAFALVFRRGDPLLWLMTSMSWMLGGILYPTDLLPEVLQQTARLLPVTHAVTGIRSALLGGGPIGEPAASLALYALVGLPVSMAAFVVALRRARMMGNLSHV